jgi:hypothetical protein
MEDDVNSKSQPYGLGSEGCGWQSELPAFYDTPAGTIVEHLTAFVRDSGSRQKDAWSRHVPNLQRECRELVLRDLEAQHYTAILEYQLPYDLRRPDIIFLERAAIVVAELKGWRGGLSQAAFDQVLGYARDLQVYHAACAQCPVIPVLVTSAAGRPPSRQGAVHVCHPNDLGEVLESLSGESDSPPPNATEFFAPNAYIPLPTIVQAARQLFETRELPYIRRARAATEPALESITAIAHEAARSGSRHLVLLSGVPGSGKTLVGLQLVHSRWLDDLAEPRSDSLKPSSAAVYLSGNGPLVQVLQDALKDAGGGGQTFVRPIKNYVEYYSKRADRIPPEHLMVYDEAQRAHDAKQVAYVHGTPIGLSEPAHLLKFCLRVPRWNVMVGLIGTGQAIHIGEEAGLPLWRDALQQLDAPEGWTVHCAPEHSEIFRGGSFSLSVSPTLNLDKELRFHLAANIHRFVGGLVDGETAIQKLKDLADGLWSQDHRFLITRELEVAKNYVRERYQDAPLARYGLLASSKDKLLPRYGVDNTFQTTKRLRVGPWYNAPANDPASCCNLEAVATEFASQGLELDCAVVAWGSDLRRLDGQWSDDLSGRYKRAVVDRLILRKNVYRVLLTRGRDGTVVYVPRAAELDDTAAWLIEAGFRELRDAPSIDM